MVTHFKYIPCADVCCVFLGESCEAEPVEGSHRVQGTDSDLMDGEAEGDTVVIAGQPEVLSTQDMQVSSSKNIWNISNGNTAHYLTLK